MVKAIMYEYKKMATKKGGKPKYLKNVGGLLMMRERQPNRKCKRECAYASHAAGNDKQSETVSGCFPPLPLTIPANTKLGCHGIGEWGKNI